MIRNIMSVLTVVLLFAISGCGSTGGGSTSYFEDGTVTYSVTPINSVLSSTVGTSPTSADSNIVTLTASNTPYLNASRKSPYTVTNITIIYTKIDDASFVLKEFATTTPMPSGGTVSIPVTIATSTIKDALLARGFSSGISWNFYVTASFTVVEDFSNKSVSYNNIQLGTVQFK